MYKRQIIYRTEKKLSPQELYGPVTEVITDLNQYISKTYGSFTFYAGISSIAYELFQLSQKIQEDVYKRQSQPLPLEWG